MLEGMLVTHGEGWHGQGLQMGQRDLDQLETPTLGEGPRMNIMRGNWNCFLIPLPSTNPKYHRVSLEVCHLMMGLCSEKHLVNIIEFTHTNQDSVLTRR
jgi:hypothetical protein